ncbi:MAG TPA: tetratricopeptide repeat protein [Chthoniobacterales bacterium]
MNTRRFFAELKRRNVYRVATAYAIVAWLVIQVVTIVFPAFDAPPWVLKVVICLVGLGFPIAVALAWAFEMTPGGIKRAEDVTRAERRANVKGRKLVVVTILAALLALGLLLFGSERGKALVKRATGGRSFSISSGADPAARSIAVLPFENMSGEPEDIFFANGIQDDLITSLAKIQELKVISRSSASNYRDIANRDLREIGRQLDVAHVLEGRVRRTADRVLVNVSLVDTRDGHQVWAERYDRTLANSLTLQGELATEIAAALRATLSPEEKARLEAKPTDNPDAWVLYLRARDYQTRPIPLMQDNQTALALYGQAIALDPDFALAHARLSAALSYSHLYFKPTAEIASRARAEADESLRLRPDLGEGHLALALWFYWTQKDYDGALRELEIAGRLAPNDVEVESIRGYIRRRQGRWAEGLKALEHAISRDPRNGQIAGELFATRYAVRDWAEAARAGERAMAVALDLPALRVNRSYIDFFARGDLESIRNALAQVPAGLDPDGSVTLAAWDVAVLSGDFAGAERVITASKVEAPRTVFGTPFSKSYLLGCVALARGDEAAARPHFEAAVPAMEAEVASAPLDAFRHGHLGLLYAYLGRKDDALREGRRAAEMLPVSKDGYDGTFVSALLALIYARTGETQQAIDLLERLLTTPGPVMPFYEASITFTELRTRWQWAPLRNDPRFQQLTSGAEPKTNY